MAALDDLLSRIHDEALRSELKKQIAPLRAERELGLVFERHLPEKVRLFGPTVRRGVQVELRADPASPTWLVASVASDLATVVRYLPDGTQESSEVPVDDLVVVREFGQPFFPGLRSLERIERGDEKPFHVVIKGENHHALEALLYACEGQVDAIYIDPPYNSGARDWKYNNDYVDTNDTYRHSKWLSFMEKRLRIAKRLLNPMASGLIVSIDEKEVHRLGLLLEQVFSGAKIQMVSSVINPKGVVRDNEFSRSDEYVFFVSIGGARLNAEPEEGAKGGPVPWQQLRRTDIASARGTKKGGKAQFYPIYVEVKTGRIHSVGEPLEPETDRSTVPTKEGCVAVFPVRDDGTEMNWGLTGGSLQRLLKRGLVQATKHSPEKPQQFTIKYLTSGRVKDIDSGEAEIVGYEDNGAAIANYKSDLSQRKMATTNWNRPSHNAQYYGTGLVNDLLGDGTFPFPKSLYAVEDALRFFVGDKPDALVLDFFGGSGTTTHAVMRLNQQDGGTRRSILITNNEVGADESDEMQGRGVEAGSGEWEEHGIFSRCTMPRIKAATTGVRADGTSVPGEYKFVDEVPLSDGFAENVEFLELTYEDGDDVRLGLSFNALAPLLWLAAGAKGARINSGSESWDIVPGGHYGVLFDADAWLGFVKRARTEAALRYVFVVTDSEMVYQRVVAEIPDTIQVVHLYEAYIRAFMSGAES